MVDPLSKSQFIGKSRMVLQDLHVLPGALPLQEVSLDAARLAVDAV